MKDIRTDDDLIEVLNDLKHYLKIGQPFSPMRGEFNDLLNRFIKKHELDGDPHAFAVRKEK